MHPAPIHWIIAIHIFGLAIWAGAMQACMRLLRVHANLPEAARQPLTVAERKAAMFMDIGATLVILSGLYLSFGQAHSPFANGGWLHAKLTLVVLGPLALHGFLRVKVRKFREGAVKPLPGILMPLQLVVLFALIVLAVVKPF